MRRTLEKDCLKDRGPKPAAQFGCSTCTPLMRWSATLGFGVGYGVRDYVSRQRHCHHRERIRRLINCLRIFDFDASSRRTDGDWRQRRSLPKSLRPSQRSRRHGIRKETSSERVGREMRLVQSVVRLLRHWVDLLLVYVPRRSSSLCRHRGNSGAAGPDLPRKGSPPPNASEFPVATLPQPPRPTLPALAHVGKLQIILPRYRYVVVPHRRH